MSDLFDDVRNEKELKKPDKHESDLEKVVNSALSNTLHKNLDNFDSFYKGFSDSYNMLNQGKVVILKGESPSKAIKEIRETFTRNLNERVIVLDELKDSVKNFRKKLETFLEDDDLRLPTTSHLTEELHLPKTLLRDNKYLDSISYEINSSYIPYSLNKYTHHLNNVIFTFKDREDDSKKFELRVNDYLTHDDLPRDLLKLSNSNLSLSILKTIGNPDFFDNVKNLIIDDAKDKSDKFYSMKENFKEIKSLLNYLNKNVGASAFFDLPQALTGVYIDHMARFPFQPETINASLVRLDDTDNFGISIQSVSASSKEILITADSKWSDFFTPKIINEFFPYTDDLFSIQKSTKVFLMNLLKNNDLVDNLHYLIENKHIPGKVSLAENPDVIKEYFSLQSELNKTREQLLSDEERERYKEDSKNLSRLKKELKTAKEVMDKWDEKIDDNRINLGKALLEIKKEYAKLGINIDTEMKEYIK